MSATSEKNQKIENQTPESKDNSTVEVLYQKLGDKWYAFSIIGEEVFFSALPPELQKQNLGK